MTEKLPVVIWNKIVTFLDFEPSAILAEVDRNLCKIMKTHRFGCQRCDRWLKLFSEDGESKDESMFSLDCMGLYCDRREMYCMCGAIYNFCEGCHNPSTFMSHGGYADAITAITDKHSTDKHLPGLGIDPASILTIKKTSYPGYEDISVFRSKPGVPMLLRQYDAEGTEIDNSDVDDDDYTQFYIGDLGRKYAIAEEQIGDQLYSFALSGSDGGCAINWHCERCDLSYGVTDK